MSSFLQILILISLLSIGAWAKPAEQTSSSSSTSALQTCLAQINSEVCDPNGVLNQEQMQKLNDALNQMEKQTAQEGYAYDKNQREKCGQKGITMPIVLLKEDTQDLSATERLLVEQNKQWTQKNPCERVAIIMLNAGDKIEQRRFWAGRNWNVNVEPSEMVQLYQKEIPLIQKADYLQALLNMLQQFTSLIGKRTGPATDQKVIIIQQKNQAAGGGGGATTTEQKTEMVKAEEGPAAVEGQQQQQQQKKAEEGGQEKKPEGTQ